ncbi:MAG: hypothetical protein ACFE9T_05505 [Promethearchaeota archaeon]
MVQLELEEAIEILEKRKFIRRLKSRLTIIGIFVICLSFLGISDPRLIEWGFYINEARAQILNAPWAVFWPGFIIMMTVLGFMLLGDGLRDALDPRLRNI